MTLLWKGRELKGTADFVWALQQLLDLLDAGKETEARVEGRFLYISTCEDFLQDDRNNPEHLPHIASQLAEGTLGWLTGEFNYRDMHRLQQLLDIPHPYLDAREREITPKEAFEIGLRLGEQAKVKREIIERGVKERHDREDEP